MTNEVPTESTVPAAPHRKDFKPFIVQSLEGCGSPTDVAIALPALAACSLTNA